MKPRRPAQRPRQKQQTPGEVLEALLDLVRRKFYEGEGVQFTKDRRLLLQWVILWPAREFFDERAVTVPADRYREILSAVLVEAAAHQTGPIKYRPAWLAKAVQSHFAIHGEEIYGEAKSARSLAEHTLLTLGKLPAQAQDALVPTFTAASRLLDQPKRPKKTASQPVLKDQLSLLVTDHETSTNHFKLADPGRKFLKPRRQG